MTSPSGNAERATFSIDIERSIDDVWRALVDSSRLARWMGAGSTIQPWIGGEINVKDLATGIPKRGRVEQVVPRTILEFVWWPTDPNTTDPNTTDPKTTDSNTTDPDSYERAGQVETRVAFELHRVPAGTRLVVTETGPPTGTMAAMASATAWRATMLSMVVQTMRKVYRS